MEESIFARDRNIFFQLIRTSHFVLLSLFGFAIFEENSTLNLLFFIRSTRFVYSFEKR